jgi:hypothetical protein
VPNDDPPLETACPLVAELQRVGTIFDTALYLQNGLHSFTNLQKIAYLQTEDSAPNFGSGNDRFAIRRPHAHRR